MYFTKNLSLTELDTSMILSQPHPLTPEKLEQVFLEELSILHNAKTHLTDYLPKFIAQATFQNLKLALTEEMEDTAKQANALQQIFAGMGEQPIAGGTIGMDAIIHEAEKQVILKNEDHYASDMSIIFYMNAIENLQLGACRVLKIVAAKPAFKAYTQLVKESFDLSKDNARLFKAVAKEYLGA